MSRTNKRRVTLSIGSIFAIGALLSVRALTELASEISTADFEESELHGPVWALAPPTASMNGQYRMSTIR